MSVLDTLVYDRTQAHVDRLKALMRIGWQNMTDEEKAEYLSGGLEQLRDANNQPLFDSNNEPLYSADSGGVQKGAYNYTDLNRVEEAVDYVADELVQLPTTLQTYAASLGVAWDSAFDVSYDPSDYSLTVKTDWTSADIPTDTDMARYYSNLVVIQSAFENPTAELPPSMNGLGYQYANNIELMLKQIDEVVAATLENTKTLIDDTAAEWFYSGELYAGEI